MIMVSATLANHMGLVEAIENVIGFKLPILNCAKCCTNWLVFFYTLMCGIGLIQCVAISLCSAYCAMWFELLLGMFSTQYNKIYENLLTEETTQSEDTENQVS